MGHSLLAMDYNPTNNKGIIGVVIEELLVCKRQTVTATNEQTCARNGR
jgi:hypothetical protein